MLRIINNYTLQILCGSPHNVGNEEGKFNGCEPNRPLRDDDGNIRYNNLCADCSLLCKQSFRVSIESCPYSEKNIKRNELYDDD